MPVMMAEKDLIPSKLYFASGKDDWCILMKWKKCLPDTVFPGLYYIIYLDKGFST